ncbi:SEL1 protein [Pelomyxa schiedti]|nr:SEL1 protein [Pelomyxa schiedti]
MATAPGAQEVIPTDSETIDDYEYFDLAEVGEDLLCPQCTRPVVWPMEHIPCGALLCYHCATMAGSCSRCREEIRVDNIRKNPVKYIDGVLASLLVYCPTCRAPVPRSQRSFHVSQCPTSCPMGCGALVKPACQLEHELSDCPLGSTICTICGSTVPKSGLNSTHPSECKCDEATELMLLGLSCWDNGNLVEAIELFSHATEASGQDPPSFFYLPAIVATRAIVQLVGVPNVGCTLPQNLSYAMYFSSTASLNSVIKFQADSLGQWSTLQSLAYARNCKATSLSEPEKYDFTDCMQSAYFVAMWEFHCKKNIKGSLPLLKKLSEGLHSGAMNTLAYCYERGEWVPKDLTKSVSLYQKAFDLGFATGPSNLGLCYKNAKGIPQDEAKAVSLFLEGIERSNCVCCLNNLATCYEGGCGVPKDREKAVLYYQRASDMGVVESTSNLGFCYLFGRGVAKDTERGMKLLERAADFHQVDAMCQVAYSIMKTNSIRAFDLYQRASDLGHVHSIFMLGTYYQSGTVVPRDQGKAVALFKKGSAAGYGLCLFELGRCYKDGKGVPKDIAYAVFLFQKGFESKSSRCTFKLGRRYEKGDGVAKNIDRAIELYKIAYELGEIGAGFHLAVMYLEGRKVPQNHSLSVPLLHKVAEAGHGRAAFILGTLYHNGSDTVAKDDDMAVMYYQMSAESSCAHGMYGLAQCYLKGEGVDRNPEAAAELLQRASDLRYNEATVALAELSRTGTGVPRDVGHAVALLHTAAAQRHTGAMMTLSSIYETGEGEVVPNAAMSATLRIQATTAHDT